MRDVLTSRRTRARLLLAGYLLAALVVVFEPFPTLAVGSVDAVYEVGRDLGAGPVLTPTLVEFLLNAVLFAPMTFLGSLILPTLSRWQWIGLALLGSVTIEVTQYLFLTHRDPSVLDVVSNTVGGTLGAVAAHLLMDHEEQQVPADGWDGIEAPERTRNERDD